jgi:parallel beta-helix repeat protein
MGATREEVILDFATQVEGDDGITVTAPGFTIENVWVKNSPGNGVVAHAEDSTFRNLKVSWDAGSVTTNGFYAVYPTDCKRTLIEGVEVVGASDAGIYVGSCEYAIVRNNKVHGNVAGLEIENTVHADVYGNEVYDNSAGILALLLPNLKIKENAHVLFRDNIVRDNNRPNFAKAGTVVSSVPTGTGMLVLCGHDIEVRNNEVTGNKSGGVLIVSYRTLELLTSTTLNDPGMDPYVRRVYVHGNTFSENGKDPQGGIKVLGQATLENVLWDGILKDGETTAEICLGDTPPTFRNFKTADAFSGQTTDTMGHTCTLPEMAKMESFE